MVRAGLRLVLEESTQVRVVGEAGDVPSAFEAVRVHRPRVAILGLNMPGGSTLAAIPALRDAAPAVAIVEALGAELAALPADGDPLPAGSSFAGHRIDGLAGRGGMAVVYRATDLALDRRV